MPPSRSLEALLEGARARSGNVSEAWDWLMGERLGLAVAEAASQFADVEVRAVAEVVEQTADELMAHFRTTSLYAQIPVDRRGDFEREDRRLIDEDGGSIRLTAGTVLLTARRR